MAKREKKESKGPAQTWLITFGDLVTLLLTFFVLLLSMASMDQSFLTRVSVFTKDIGFLTYRGSGQIPSRIKMIIELMERPQDVLLEDDRIKDLLFPDDVLPPGIDRGTLEENLRILRRQDGVALVLSDKLLFASGSASLAPEADPLLAQIATVLQYLPFNVNVAGFSDNVPGRTKDNYQLSGERAESVLDYFLKHGFDPIRFSISAFGPNLPIAPNATPEGRAANRRVEILVKTQTMLGSYS
ncbi:MAG: OmpA/MotB family protein [Desulfovibrio sp.]|uniref:OmpA/MotB family protein n=1 Tax=Desulfovibrio sp. 7SRBS1 TaxID=3378064 RepID=UPI003B417394